MKTRLIIILFIGFVLMTACCCVFANRFNFVLEIAEAQQYNIELQAETINKLIDRIKELEKPMPDIDIDYIEGRIASARDVHNDYILNPDWCSKRTGNFEFHKRWVEDYDLTLDLIKWVGGFNDNHN